MVYGVKLSVASLFVGLMRDPIYRRGKWADRNLRRRFFLRSLIHPLTTVRYLRGLCELDITGRLLEAHPVLPAKPQRPYLYRGGSVRQRSRDILDHHYFVQGLPERSRRLLQIYRETPLLSAEGKHGEQLDISCAPCGFDREGELMLMLRFNGTIITRISFSFIHWQGNRTLFIGGLQGPARGEGVDIIRRATRACHGLFPRRLLCEILSELAVVCHVDGIVAVSEDSHVLRQRRYFYRKKGRFVARYSECWSSVGGQVLAGGFYALPVRLPRKAAGDIPARKRAEYRKRNALLDYVRMVIQVRMSGYPGQPVRLSQDVLE